MTETTAKKPAAKKAAPKPDQNPHVKPEGAAPPEMKRLRVTHYKVRTSAGKRIAGQYVDLPVFEADELIGLGHAEEV